MKKISYMFALLMAGSFSTGCNNSSNEISSLKGHIVDVTSQQIFSITPCQVPSDAPYYMPGFVDAHMHIEATELGTSFKAPYMTMAFMSLLVIPELKLSDKGLFDGEKFSFTSLVN